MTIQAQFWVRTAGQGAVERVLVLTGHGDVDALLERLDSDDVSDVVATHSGRPLLETLIPDDDHPGQLLRVPDHSVVFGRRGARGAISYNGFDGHGTEAVHLYSKGSGTDGPATYETAEFPPGSEIAASELAAALKEFLDTARRPLNIQWQPAA